MDVPPFEEAIMIGLAGVKNIGKGELARTYAQNTGCYLIQDTTKGTYDRLGLTGAEPMTPRGVLDIQRQALYDLNLRLEGAPPYFISEITPIDIMARVYAIAGQDPSLSPEIEKFWMVCHALCIKHYGLLTIVQPADHIVEGTKTVTAEMEQASAIITGICMGRFEVKDELHIIILKRHLVSLQARINTLLDFSKQYFPNHILLSESATIM